MDTLQYRGSTYSLASTASDSDSDYPPFPPFSKSHHVFPVLPDPIDIPSHPIDAPHHSHRPKKPSPKMSSLLTALRRLSFKDDAKPRRTHRRAHSALTITKSASSATVSTIIPILDPDSGLSAQIQRLELHRSNSVPEATPQPITRTRKRVAEDEEEPHTPPNPIPLRPFLERRAWSEKRASLPRIITTAPISHSRPSSPSSASSDPSPRQLLPPSPIPSFPPFTPIETSLQDIAVLTEETTSSEGITVSDPSFFLVPTTCDKRRQPEEFPFLRPIKKLKHLNGRAFPAAATFLTTRDHLMPTAIDVVEFIKARGGRCTEGEVFLRFRTGESEHVRSVVNVILDHFSVVKVGSDRRRWVLLKTDSAFSPRGEEQDP